VFSHKAVIISLWKAGFEHLLPGAERRDINDGGGLLNYGYYQLFPFVSRVLRMPLCTGLIYVARKVQTCRFNNNEIARVNSK
jgi:hypothetical protein